MITTIASFAVLWFFVVFAVWQTVEIIHHSLIGRFWRNLAIVFLGFRDPEEIIENGRPFEVSAWLGIGMLCPFCYSNWIALMYCGAVSFILFFDTSFIIVLLCTVLGGLSAARAANLCNDLTRHICRTPNTNPYSASRKMRSQLEDAQQLDIVDDANKDFGTDHTDSSSNGDSFRE